jgi:hypothetical protein
LFFLPFAVLERPQVKKWRHMCGVYAYRLFTREQFVEDHDIKAT